MTDLIERTKSGAAASSSIMAESERQTVQEDYFSELLGYSVERLSKEPELLRADQEQLRRHLQDTAVNHYRAFIGAAQCIDGLQTDLAEAANSLDALIKDLPKLQAATETFRRDAAEINAKRAANRQLYSTHSQLLELLEVPQLMETCIRNGNYDEALDLRAFINKIATVHGDLPVVQRLVQDVNQVSDSMLEQLLQRLETNVQLPECLRVIGYMRRLAAFPERDLRLQYLQRREAWIAGLVADLDDSNSYEYLKRLTDIYRLNFFDVVMQYRAMFADSDSAAPTTTGSTSSLTAAAAKAPSDGGILYSWSERRVAAYLQEVQRHLSGITDGGSLASVLDHAMYCGASLGRVGLDFRPLLAPLFEEAVRDLFVGKVATAVDVFSNMLEGHKWIALPSIAARARQQQQQQAAAAAEKGADGEPTADGKQPTDSTTTTNTATTTLSGPPYTLMEHPPLAVLANGLLAALNELRHCAPLSLKEESAVALRGGLQHSAACMARFGSSSNFGETEKMVFGNACRALVTSLIPYIATCFDRVYSGGATLLDLKGVVAILEGNDKEEEEEQQANATTTTSAKK